MGLDASEKWPDPSSPSSCLKKESGGCCCEVSEGLTRREFLSLAGGVMVFFTLGGQAGVEAEVPAPVKGELPDELTAWLRISPEGRITVFAPTPEVGQGLRTCLTQLAAEELSVPVEDVTVVLGDTDRVPPDPGVPTSEAISAIGPYVRQAAAHAREMLLDIAAAKWGVAREQVELRDGRVVVLSDPLTSTPIGELARGRKLSHKLDPPAILKPAAEWTIIGQSVPSLDGPTYVRGRARYAADIRLPNLVYGRILRPPCIGATLVNADTRPAAAQPGVVAVVRDGGFIGVIATRPDLADRALLSIQATWDESKLRSVATLYQDLRSSAKSVEKLGVKGDVEAAMAGARDGFSASYRLPFTAYAPMEPGCAVSDPKDDRMIVYVSTERPFTVRNAVARALGISAGRIRVITTAVGGAFGGKDAPDISVQAARLAQAVRRPVMLMQSREEQMSWNAFRPAAIVDIRSGVSAAGEIVAWDCDVLNCGPRGAIPPYGFATQRVRSYRCDPLLPRGPSRALGAPANTFAREVHMDHIAAQLGLDPIGLRLRHMADDSRLSRTVTALVERYRWKDRRPPTGQGVGFALAMDAGSCAAAITEVDVDRGSGQVHVRRVWIAQDSGTIVNPGNTRNQIEGGVVMGIGLALKEAVRYELGRVLSRTFATYSIPTFRDAPETDITLVTNADLPPQGDGTAAFCAIAPAVANAVFDATGKRLRDLPLAAAAIRTTG